MAVDTRHKRNSVLDFGSISTDTLPHPDASVGADDRVQLLDLYSGITLDAPAADPDPTQLAAQTWSKAQPLAQTWRKDQPSGQTWSTT